MKGYAKDSGNRQLTGMWLKLVIGAVHEKLRRGVVGELCDDGKEKITYPFMGFLEIKSIYGFETTRHDFLRKI
jgi:hypothetical protein